MDLKTRHKYFIKKSPASYKRRCQVNISSQTETCLTPLQRLERFKKVQQKFQSQKTKKRVHFSMDMEPEMSNGSNEDAVSKKEDTPQKILRPRKPQLDEIIENGNEHGPPVNGHRLNGCDDEGNKEQFKDKRDTSSKKPQKKILKEGTPLRDTPMELRRRESTPLSDKKGSPTKYNVVEHDSDINVESQTKSTEEPTQDPENTNEHTINSVVIIEDSIIEGSDSKSPHENYSVNESHDNAYVATSQNSPSLINKDKCEASSSSPSIICLDSPSIETNYDLSNNDFKGRKPINSFSKFPGRTVSVTSLKRKSNDSYEEKDRKRFVGNVESDQRKSSGWNLTWLSSPFGKAWSPSSQLANATVTSTPFTKRNLEDSMAVNYDENTKRSLDVSSDNGQSETQSIQKSKKSTCTIM